MAESSVHPAYVAAVAEIDREIEELRRARAILLRRAGAGAGRDVDTDTNGGTSVHAPAFQGDALAAIREQEFSGLSATKAARAFLLKIGRHEKTPTIIAAIAKGGVVVGGKNPVASMFTALKRHSAFVPMGKNYWDLAERRPDLVKSKNEKVEKPRKKRRYRRRLKTIGKEGTEGGG